MAPVITLPLRDHWYVSGASPEAAADRVTEAPAASVWKARGCSVITGGAVRGAERTAKTGYVEVMRS